MHGSLASLQAAHMPEVWMQTEEHEKSTWLQRAI